MSVAERKYMNRDQGCAEKHVKQEPMYRCIVCGSTFPHGGIVEISYAEYPGASLATYDASPCCHSEYEEVAVTQSKTPIAVDQQRILMKPLTR